MAFVAVEWDLPEKHIEQMTFKFIKKSKTTKTRVKPNTFAYLQRLGVGFRYIYLQEWFIANQHSLHKQTGFCSFTALPNL